jgi:hypothetical protein
MQQTSFSLSNLHKLLSESRVWLAPDLYYTGLENNDDLSPIERLLKHELVECCRLSDAGSTNVETCFTACDERQQTAALLVFLIPIPHRPPFAESLRRRIHRKISSVPDVAYH